MQALQKGSGAVKHLLHADWSGRPVAVSFTASIIALCLLSGLNRLGLWLPVPWSGIFAAAFVGGTVLRRLHPQTSLLIWLLFMPVVFVVLVFVDLMVVAEFWAYMNR